MQEGMALGRSLGVVLFAVVLVVSGQRLTPDNVKVVGESGVKIQKSINHAGKYAQNLIYQDDQSSDHKIQEMQTRTDTIADMFDFIEPDFHSLAGKPSKLDRDISELIHTDLKSMHEDEAARLESERDNKESNSATSTTTLVSTTIDANDSQWNATRRIDSSTDDDGDETTFVNVSGVRNGGCNGTFSMPCLEEDLERVIEKMSSFEVYNITDFAQIVRKSNSSKGDVSARDISVIGKLARYANQHILKIRMPSDLSTPRGPRFFFGDIFQGKSSFLTGFGLGFLAFGLKKLMLPLFIGMQIVKSVLIALFLPSILGGIGKILGKSVSTFSQVSQSAAAQPEESFEFKDNANIYNDDYMHSQPIGTLPASEMYANQGLLNTGTQYVGTPGANQRISHASPLSDNYYSRNSMQGATKQQDYKIFHEIPTSSLLLTNYDPFYSPLLSRLDAVFSRLGHSTESCREYAICAMYRSPARYAPYSNLVSAQLSRELNELRKPTSDNPDVLRFFKYMKAAKDGQDGVQCEDVYTDCTSRGDNSGQNQAMLATYQDINKLVQARKI